MFGHKKDEAQPVKKVKKHRRHKHEFVRSFIVSHDKYYVADACTCGLFKNLRMFEYDTGTNGDVVMYRGCTLEYLQKRYGNLRVYSTDNIFGTKCTLIKPLEDDEEE